MVVLGINSCVACFCHFHSRHCEINFFERRRRARIDAENGHRRVTRPRLRIIVKETRGYPTGYLRVQSGTVEYDREQHELKAGREQDEAVYGYGETTMAAYNQNESLHPDSAKTSHCIQTAICL